MNAQLAPAPASMNPDLRIDDPVCAHWLAQVTWRLRREIAWCWHQRGGSPGRTGALPPFSDPVQDSLDLTRFRDDKRAFFAQDVTARYLSDCIASPNAPTPPQAGRRGGWHWLAHECGLPPAAQFVLACALASRSDAAIGAVCAACLNDPSRPWPTLALAQRLWDEPLAVAACADAGHALFRHGLLNLPPGRALVDWHQALDMPTAVAQALLTPDHPPRGMIPATELVPRDTPLEMQPWLARLRSDPPSAMQVLPLQAPQGTDFLAWARTFASATGRGLVVMGDEVTPDRGLQALATASWLHGADILLPEHWQERCCAAGTQEHWTAPLSDLPLRWYLPSNDGGQATRGLPSKLVLPTCHLPPLDIAQRTQLLCSALRQSPPAVRNAIPEAARRFRLAERPLARAACTASALGTKAEASDLFKVCRAEARLELDGLANAVTPRFDLNELVLPTAQAQQLREIVSAMRVLGRVHHEWGTARAWNEAGLSVLFCGPPGTGKTMAAEALANELQLPMYRIDLSQVVNKYIGETEKNLRRIFDAAETSDCLMFFDEADALFGKRTEVKDAHDRFANIEISYLLERMERFKGLAVLASNRRKDLDEAFTRRLRHIVEFPVPGAAEREQLWRRVFPQQVDIREVDCAWLAQQFEMAGGHIRSAAFNACLLAASQQAELAPARVGMPQVLIAIKRELQKMNRVAGREQFGRYASLMEDMA
ncbi:ATP-binding protein [Aquabacterium sp.]|uniref:ATP-binding protein n=1 Tax=Aquabacterium sp. TaxID=1872578 RepID=UPI003D6D2B92